jgi:hypothetical protein
MITIKIRNPYLHSKLSYINFYRIEFYNTSDYQTSWKESSTLSEKVSSYFTEKEYCSFKDETLGESMDAIAYLIGIGWIFESGFEEYNQWISTLGSPIFN